MFKMSCLICLVYLPKENGQDFLDIAVSWYESMSTSDKPGPGPDEERQAAVMDYVQRGLDNHTDKDSERYRRELLCVQEVVTPIYIMSYYINWGNYFLDTR
mgnify:CR=1 FL=1